MSPKIMDFAINDNYEFLLFSEVAVKNAFKCIEDIELTITLLAYGLCRIHNIPIKHCTYDNSLDIKLCRARFRVENNLVDETDFEEKYGPIFVLVFSGSLGYYFTYIFV